MPRGDAAVEELFEGQTVLRVQEDLTQGWTLVHLSSHAVVAITLIDPDVRVARLPLQPPYLTAIEGTRIAAIRDSGGKVYLTTESLDLLRWAMVSRRLSLPREIATAVSQFVRRPQTVVPLMPIFERKTAYPVAITVLLGPTSLCPPMHAFVHGRHGWSKPQPLRFPPPAPPPEIAAAMTASGVKGGKNGCCVM
eukprot:Sspe_Gene.90678::Locus_62180_Transcript_1_1_Confidence_1.000_Length_785::g.90678::m.90678